MNEHETRMEKQPVEVEDNEAVDRYPGTPVTRSIPGPKHVPGEHLSRESSEELQRELADIRWAEIAAAGPGVVGGRPAEPPRS